LLIFHKKLGHLPAVSRNCGEIMKARFTVDTHTKRRIVIDVKGKRKKEKFPTNSTNASECRNGVGIMAKTVMSKAAARNIAALVIGEGMEYEDAATHEGVKASREDWGKVMATTYTAPKVTKKSVAADGVIGEVMQALRDKGVQSVKLAQMNEIAKLKGYKFAGASLVNAGVRAGELIKIPTMHGNVYKLVEFVTESDRNFINQQ